MKRIYILLFLLGPFIIKAQYYDGLTSEERAYLYHIVKKSPILNNNFGRFFDYNGPEVKFPNQTINYDSVELLIIKTPSLLVIRKNEIAKSAKGLIAEASNKMAIWELNKTLLAKRIMPNKLGRYASKFERYEKFLLEKLPPSVITIKDGKAVPSKKLNNLMNPSLSFDDKVMFVESIRLNSKLEEVQVLSAFNHAINQYVSQRAFEIFQALGGVAIKFNNVLIAAGDGSSTTGILEEREKDERGRWNKGLPKAVGLFPYEIIIEKTEVKRKMIDNIEPMRYTISDFKTAGHNKKTNLHFDVWGYNSKKQTTVVIEKNGLSYHLFGAKDTRFLSPDSSFSEGTTFQAIINDLEFNKIAKLHKLVFGKKGFDHWIEFNQKKKDGTEMKIVKREKDYSDMGYSPIQTSSKPSRQVKKSKRKAIKNNKDNFNGAPTTSSRRKERKKLQTEIVHLYGLFEAYKKKIAELERQKKEALDLIAVYQRKLDTYKRLMGRKWAKYAENDGLYLFEDSTTFDILTQEFQFKANDSIEDFEVRLIAIPESCLSKSADEVMIHINAMDAKPDYDARINIKLEDVFESDQWSLNSPLFSKKDSVSLLLLFEALLDKQIDLNIIARGQGIGKWNGFKTIKDYRPKELSNYPSHSQTSKFDSTFLRLRKSEVVFTINRSIQLEINSYTDPVRSNLKLLDASINSAMSKYRLSKNDILSAYRTATIARQLKQEISIIAGNYLTRPEAKIVIDRFNKALEKIKINVGVTSFKLSAF